MPCLALVVRAQLGWLCAWVGRCVKVHGDGQQEVRVPLRGRPSQHKTDVFHFTDQRFPQRQNEPGQFDKFGVHGLRPVQLPQAWS